MIPGTTACSSTQFSAAVWDASKDFTVAFNRFDTVARKFLRSPNGACNYGRTMKQHLLTRSCLCKRVTYSVAAELQQFFLRYVTANNAERSRAPLLRQTFRLHPQRKSLAGAE